jgi:hypothetical protein
MIKSYFIRAILVIVFVLNIQNGTAQEEKYIGLFLYNFTKYFDWPDNTKSQDFIVEVLGHKSVFDELTRLTVGKKVGNQNIVIKNLNTFDETGISNILFVGHWQSRTINDILNKMGSNSTLIVTEMDGMLDKGSAINFIIREGTIKFEINLTNIKKRQLKVDPRIRELAYKVVE